MQPSTCNHPQAFQLQVEGIFETLRLVHIVVYIASLALAGWAAFGLVKPYVKNNARQTRQVGWGGGACACVWIVRSVVQT
jgi:hypothetical protein